MSRGFTLRDERLEALQTDIKTTIVAAEIKHHIPRPQTIKFSEMSASNFYKAMSRPELFRVGQLYRIYEGLNVPEAERRYV